MTKVKMLLVLLMACGTAQAADWVRLGPDGNQTRFYVDASSVTFDGDNRTAWFKFTYSLHSTKSDDGTKYLSSELEMMEILCTKKQVRLLSDLFRFEDGSALDKDATPWRPIPPDTYVDVAMDYLCKLTPKPTT